MSPRQISVIIAVVAALGGAVAIANPSLRLQSIAQAPTAQPSPDESNRPDRPDNPDKAGWLKDLNLSADQVQKIKAIRSQYKDKISQERQSLDRSQQELRELMAGNAPAAQVREKYSQVRTLKRQVADAQFESMLATREVLNTDQRRKFAERMIRQRQYKDRL